MKVAIFKRSFKNVLRAPHLPSNVMFFCGAIYDPVDPEYTPFCVASVMEPEGIDCMTLV